jgi:hypothetical protein
VMYMQLLDCHQRAVGPVVDAARAALWHVHLDRGMLCHSPLLDVLCHSPLSQSMKEAKSQLVEQLMHRRIVLELT